MGICTRCAQKDFPCGPYELKEESERYLTAQKARPTLPSYIENDNVELNRSVPTSNTRNRDALQMQQEEGEILDSHYNGLSTSGTSMEGLLVGTSTPWNSQEPIDPHLENLSHDFFDLPPTPTADAASPTLSRYSGPRAESNRSDDYRGQQCWPGGEIDTKSPYVICGNDNHVRQRLG